VAILVPDRRALPGLEDAVAALEHLKAADDWQTRLFAARDAYHRRQAEVAAEVGEFREAYFAVIREGVDAGRRPAAVGRLLRMSRQRINTIVRGGRR
jgi:hypothetical protein